MDPLRPLVTDDINVFFCNMSPAGGGLLRAESAPFCSWIGQAKLEFPDFSLVA